MGSWVSWPSSGALRTEGVGRSAAVTSGLKDRGLLSGESRRQPCRRGELVCIRTGIPGRLTEQKRLRTSDNWAWGEKVPGDMVMDPRWGWRKHQLSESFQEKERQNSVLMLSKENMGETVELPLKKCSYRCCGAQVSPVHGLLLLRKQWQFSGDHCPSWLGHRTLPLHILSSLVPLFIHSLTNSYSVDYVCARHWEDNREPNPVQFLCWWNWQSRWRVRLQRWWKQWQAGLKGWLGKPPSSAVLSPSP